MSAGQDERLAARRSGSARGCLELRFHRSAGGISSTAFGAFHAGGELPERVSTVPAREILLQEDRIRFADMTALAAGEAEKIAFACDLTD